MRNILFLGVVLSLANCATLTSGTSQSMMILTPKVEAAACDLSDSKGGQWYLKETPGSVTVRKGDGPMTVICRKDKFHTATEMVEESFAGATLGNILLGGGIGIGVDIISGAAQKYPDQVVVLMYPKEFANDEEKAKWEKIKAEDQAKKLKKKEEEIKESRLKRKKN